MRVEPENLLEISQSVESLLAAKEALALRRLVEPLHPADLAELLRLLDEDRRAQFLRLLEPHLASDVLEEVADPVVGSLLRSLTDEEVGHYIEEMPSDEGADVAQHLPDERREHVLEVVEEETATELRELLRFDEESAGGLMSLELWAVHQDSSVGSVVEGLREAAEEVENLYNVYVVDDRGLLVGSLSVVQLLLADPAKKIREIMNVDPMFVTTEMDQEQVAGIFKRYDLMRLPVVDGEGRLVGRIRVEEALKIMEEEASEDITMMAGTDEAELGETSSLKVSRARLPWLVLGLAGGVASAVLMSRFELSLERVIALAFFVPVIMALGGNVSIQSSTVAVRSLALEDMSAFRVGRRIIKEIKVAIFNGFILAGILVLTVGLWLSDFRLGLVLGMVVILVCFLGTFVGASVPFLLKKLSIDPAIATGPFITTSNDLLGLFLYLGLATILLDWLR